MKPTPGRKAPPSEHRSSSSAGSRSGNSGSGGSAERTDRTPAGANLGTLGRFRLLGRIGEGGMAEVYRAMMIGPEGFERELVLKRILPRLSQSGDFKTMFIREAKIAAQMLHPNIVQIYEFGQAEGGYFIAMESVQGVTLRELLTTLRKDERAVPYNVAADITRQICIGLDYAHTLRGYDGEPLEIVHQDISPTNIMLAFTGTVKILDFGIARAAEFAEEEAKKGMIKGKVSYLSPEQIFVRPFDARADIFALGVVFHEMLTGRRLFQSRNDINKMRELLAAPILPPSAIDAMIPRELDRIVMKALEIDPKDRYQSSADMAADLERTLIAARYSSRDLSKLLHGLYTATDEPVVVIDAADEKDALEHTVAITSTQTLPPAEQTRSSILKAKDETQIRMEGVLRAERSRLERMRWVGRVKVMFTALAFAAVVGAAAYAAKKYGPDLVKVVRRPGPAPTPVMQNQEAPAPPAAKPAPAKEPAKPAAKKPQRGAHRGKGHSTAAADENAAPAPDAPLPMSPQ
jgi:serine/threonine protein kinase